MKWQPSVRREADALTNREVHSGPRLGKYRFTAFTKSVDWAVHLVSVSCLLSPVSQ